MTTRGEDDSVRMDHIARAIGRIEAVSAEGRAVVDQEPCDVDTVEHGDVQLFRTSEERALDLKSRVVAREGRAPELVGAEKALGYTAVLFPRERHTVPFQIVDSPAAPWVTIWTVRGSASR